MMSAKHLAKSAQRRITIPEWVDRVPTKIVVGVSIIIAALILGYRADHAQEQADVASTNAVGTSNVILDLCSRGDQVAATLYSEHRCAQAASVRQDPTVLVGPRGETGASGQPGSPGLQGIPGPQGPAGPMGPAGPTGLPGLPGTPGRDGHDGAPGQTGPQGSTGPQGPAGRDGSNGSNGSNGQPGDQGPAGPPYTPPPTVTEQPAPPDTGTGESNGDANSNTNSSGDSLGKSIAGILGSR